MYSDTAHKTSNNLFSELLFSTKSTRRSYAYIPVITLLQIMINDPFYVQSLPCKQGSCVSKTPPKIQSVQFRVQVTELVVVHTYCEYPLFPNSCLQLSQPRYTAVEEFCHQSQIKDYKGYNTGALYFLFRGYSALLCRGLALVVKTINGSLALDSCYQHKGCPRVWPYQPRSALAEGSLCSAGMS